MARNSNGFLSTDTEIIGFGGGKEYSGASGIYVDNVNNIISITGDVGKEYNGIDPIVVNNEENLISANSAPIGVQEPLYFVQDDDEGVIIGLSGEYVTPSDIAGKLDTSSFESWQQGQYTNDLTALNQKINDVSANVPSIEGLATEQLVEETSANIVSQIPSTAGLASETYVQEQTSGKASKSELETVSGDIVNLIPDTSNFITNVSAEETYQPKGNYLSSNALEGYATENWVTAQGYLTGVDLSNYYAKDETSGAEQLAEAFANIPGGEGDAEVNALVHSNSAEWNDVSSKLDESTFQEASGLFLTAIPQEYVTETDIPSFISGKLDTTSFADVSGSFLTAVDLTPYVPASSIGRNVLDYITGVSGFDISAKRAVNAEMASYANSAGTAYKDRNGNTITSYYQPKLNIEGINGTITAINSSALYGGDEEVNLAVHTNSATWNTVTDKLDTTAFSDVSGSFLTAHQDLSDYYTTADANTLSSMLSAAIDYVSANAGDEFPVSADEAIQYVQSNSANIDDTVTSYQTNSGTFLTAHQAISAEEWNDCYDNVNTNSGVWGGSALPISAGPGVKLELVNNTLVVSNDETVLWEDNTDPAAGINGTRAINEDVSNFESIDVYFWRCSDHSQTYRYYQVNRVPVISGNANFATFWQESTAWFKMFLRISGTTATFREGHYTNAGLTDTLTETDMYSQGNIFKIVGINRIAGGN